MVRLKKYCFIFVSTSFVGVTLYCFFGTSKDISIGPICKTDKHNARAISGKKTTNVDTNLYSYSYLATVSLLVSTVVNSVIKINPTITPSEVAVTLGLFAGIISIIISLLRLGILVDFIPGMIEISHGNNFNLN
jgi:MFS superfamily sulfate permease-like transporter